MNDQLDKSSHDITLRPSQEALAEVSDQIIPENEINLNSEPIKIENLSLNEVKINIEPEENQINIKDNKNEDTMLPKMKSWIMRPPLKRIRGGGDYQGYPPDGPYPYVGPEYIPEDRNPFIARVFLVVSAMLLVTFAFLLIVLQNDVLKDHFKRMALFYLIASMILYMTLSYCFVCGPCSRNLACGIILLVLTCIAMTMMTATVCVAYKLEVIMYAFLATAIISLICMGLACSNFDFTSYLLYVVVFSTLVFALAIIAMVLSFVFGIYLKPLHIVILLLSALVQSVTMIIEIQMILGRRTLEFSEEEYALAAFQLYTSIIQMFITMVQLIGLCERG